MGSGTGSLSWPYLTVDPSLRYTPPTPLPSPQESQPPVRFPTLPFPVETLVYLLGRTEGCERTPRSLKLLPALSGNKRKGFGKHIRTNYTEYFALFRLIFKILSPSIRALRVPKDTNLSIITIHFFLSEGLEYNKEGSRKPPTRVSFLQNTSQFPRPPYQVKPSGFPSRLLAKPVPSEQKYRVSPTRLYSV